MRALILLILLAAPVISADSEGVNRYIHGDYDGALPLLRAEMAANPGNDRVAAALLASLVEQNLYGEATRLSGDLAARFPESAAALTARGDFEFLSARLSEAEKLYRAALARDERTARAWLGLARIARANSLYKSGEEALKRAHELMPEEAAVRLLWTLTRPRQERTELLSALLAEHPKWTPHVLQTLQGSLELAKVLKGQASTVLDGPAVPATVKLVRIMRDVSSQSGWGIRVTFNGKQTFTLQLDTGAGGILLDQKAAERAGIRKVADVDIQGVGHEGWRKSWTGLADACAAGAVSFRNCRVHVTALDDVTGRDGLIGTDVFNDFLVRISLRERALQLTPQPDWREGSGFYDRTQVSGFTPVRRSGHSLFVPVRINDGKPGLFIIDTGAWGTVMDDSFAATFAKLHRVAGVAAGGVSGKVYEVKKAEDVTIQVIQFRQQHRLMLSMDLNPEGMPTEIRRAGLLGVDVLRLFDVTIDYRNGLVKFEYTGNR